MDEKYFARKVEKKWQKIWAESKAFRARQDSQKPKFYQLEMLPYPSGNLHMGHVRNYSAGDALAWFKRLQGFNVLHPIGWDSFGQPAEDAAVKRGVNPRHWTEENISAMRGQLERLGLSYDWSRQIYAHTPEYYKWDQWFFLKMYEKGLAYKRLTQVNWCSHDRATLSNEQASGGLCWRCGNKVTKKDLEQWFLKTTAYSEELLNDMADLESRWPQNVLKRQSDWIGRSVGAIVDFDIKGAPDRISVFTTRIDTIYGVNAIVVAAEHPVIQKNKSGFSDDVLNKVTWIAAENAAPADHEIEIEKDGIDTGLKAINPFSGEEVPVWVGNYVMMGYGTGAVMSVPAHDERDFEFASKFRLPIRRVIFSSPASAVSEEQPADITTAFEREGTLMNSDQWNGLSSVDARTAMTEYALKRRFGKAATTYRLRDWGISRQRYWGAPIPIVYCDRCGVVPEKYDNLPIALPEDAPITGTGESPLSKVAEFYNTKCPDCDGPACRETDTMDTFVDSSWYFFRYVDPDNSDVPVDSQAAAYWMPVDQYIGGDDHAVMHLIYARFWTKVMRDIGLIDFGEPFVRLLTQGMVVGETFYDEDSGKRSYYKPDDVSVSRDEKGKIVAAVSSEGRPLSFGIERMSKSKGNGVDPDEMVDIYGADASRLFILFAAPIENELVWNESGIEGGVRFLQRVWRLVYRWHQRIREISGPPPQSAGDSMARNLRRKTHQTIRRVEDSLSTLQFNTPIAALMELSNAIAEIGGEPEHANDERAFAIFEALTALVLMLTPIAPHISEELYAVLIGNDQGIVANEARFPEFIEELAKADLVEIAVQVNGKLRAKVMAPPATSDDDLRNLAMADEKVGEFVNGRQVAKVIVVPGRLVNIVVKG